MFPSQVGSSVVMARRWVTMPMWRTVACQRNLCLAGRDLHMEPNSAGDTEWGKTWRTLETPGSRQHTVESYVQWLFCSTYWREADKMIAPDCGPGSSCCDCTCSTHCTPAGVFSMFQIILEEARHSQAQVWNNSLSWRYSSKPEQSVTSWQKSFHLLCGFLSRFKVHACVCVCSVCGLEYIYAQSPEQGLPTLRSIILVTGSASPLFPMSKLTTSIIIYHLVDH